MDLLCHACITTGNLSYRFPIFETSATALCGTTGIPTLQALVPAQATEHNALLQETAWQRALEKWLQRAFVDRCCGGLVWGLHLAWDQEGKTWRNKYDAKVLRTEAETVVLKSLDLLLATRPTLFDTSCECL